jgi:hypothetical protein
VQAARELRDRWSEAAEMRPASAGKYDPARQIEARSQIEAHAPSVRKRLVA